MIKIFTIVVVLILRAPFLLFAEENKNHFNHYSTYESDSFEETFDRQNEYYRCETKNLCPVIKDEEAPYLSKRYAIFIRREKDNMLIPSFVQCYKNGSATVSMAENLIPILNRAVEKGDTECIKEEAEDFGVPKTLIQNSIDAIEKYNGNCPPSDKDALEQAAEALFLKDIRNLKKAVNLDTLKDIFSFNKKEENKKIQKVGCLGNISNLIYESLKGTLLFFARDIPSSLWNTVKSGWNYFFDQEEEHTASMIAASVLPQDMVDALGAWDFNTFYELLRKKLFKFLADIREFYTETIGCTEWTGRPYNSECLKKMNWSCPTTENIIQYTCGLAGQLGASALLGGVLGNVNAMSSMRRLQKSVALNPKKFGLSNRASQELTTKSKLQAVKESVGNKANEMTYGFNRKYPGISEFLVTAKDEIETVSGIMGKAFQKLTAYNPATMTTHLSYQFGKNHFYKKNLDRRLKNRKSSVATARIYSAQMNKMEKVFENKLRLLYRLRGSAFDPGKYLELIESYYDEVTPILKKMGIKVERRKGATSGLVLRKNGERFHYKFDIRDKLKAATENTRPGELHDLLTIDDPFLSKLKNNEVKSAPHFAHEIRRKAGSYQNFYRVESTGLDGYVYMAHFSSITDNIEKSLSCEGHLSGAHLFRSQDITPTDQ